MCSFLHLSLRLSVICASAPSFPLESVILFIRKSLALWKKKKKMCRQWTQFSHLIYESLRKHSSRSSLLPRDSGKVLFKTNGSSRIAELQTTSLSKHWLVQGHNTCCFSALRLDGCVQKTMSSFEAVSPGTPWKFSVRLILSFKGSANRLLFVELII